MPDAIGRLGHVHHVALIVRSIDDALGLWRDALHLELETVMDIPDDRVRIAFLGVGESKIELVEPTDDTTGVARFLANKGEGFHHVCFEVANLAETLLRLEIDGIELIDIDPTPGRRGSGRLPPSAVVPRRAGRAHRGAGRAGLGVARLLTAGQAGFVASSENISGSSPPASGGRRHLPSTVVDEEVDLPVEERVLDERLDPQAGVDQRGDDLAEAVVPAVLGLLADVRVRVGVRALDLEDQRLRVLPVRVAQAQLARLDALVLETPGRPGGPR